MNLRIHKKLSKRAAQLIPLLGDKRKQYKADKGGCYFGSGRLQPCDFKHWDRCRVRFPLETSVKVKPKDGKGWIVIHRPDNPLKGTVMVGNMSGGYEPEWFEETAWEALCLLVEYHFTEWDDVIFDEKTGNPGFAITRDLSNVSKILQAADEIVAAKRMTA